jgi:hypothetical protein
MLTTLQGALWLAFVVEIMNFYDIWSFLHLNIYLLLGEHFVSACIYLYWSMLGPVRVSLNVKNSQPWSPLNLMRGSCLLRLSGRMTFLSGSSETNELYNDFMFMANL